MKDLLQNWLEDAFQRNMPISLQEAKYKARTTLEQEPEMVVVVTKICSTNTWSGRMPALPMVLGPPEIVQPEITQPNNDKASVTSAKTEETHTAGQIFLI